MDIAEVDRLKKRIGEFAMVREDIKDEDYKMYGGMCGVITGISQFGEPNIKMQFKSYGKTDEVFFSESELVTEIPKGGKK